MSANIRRLMVCVDETRIEMGRAVDPPVRRAVAIAVIANPYAGRWSDDLSELIDLGEYLGDELMRRCQEALGDPVEAYGKGGIVGQGMGFAQRAAEHPVPRFLVQPFLDQVVVGEVDHDPPAQRGDPGGEQHAMALRHIEENYSSLEEYLEQALGVGPAELAELRSRYLE